MYASEIAEQRSLLAFTKYLTFYMDANVSLVLTRTEYGQQIAVARYLEVQEKIEACLKKQRVETSST